MVMGMSLGGICRWGGGGECEGSRFGTRDGGTGSAIVIGDLG